MFWRCLQAQVWSNECACFRDSARRPVEMFAKSFCVDQRRGRDDPKGWKSDSGACQRTEIGRKSSPMNPFETQFCVPAENVQAKHIPINNMRILIHICILASVVGCASTDSLVTDTTKRTATMNVQILSSKPKDEAYKQIGIIQFLGPKEDELKATKYLQKEARKAGADAMFLEQEEFQKWVAFIPTTAVKYKAHLFVTTTKNH